MRVLPESLAALLAGGVTTLCRCWEVRRGDGVVMGFTDHDRDIAFDSVTYAAETGVSASAIEIATGLSVDSHAVTGALRSTAITEEDIERGLWDSARVTLWLVDWLDTASRIIVSRGVIGEMRRRGVEFEAEVVGLAEALNQPIGRAYLRKCGVRLGDAKCGVDLNDAARRGQAAVATVAGAGRYEVSGLQGFAAGFFAQGGLTWTSGANVGATGQVRSHLGVNPARIELWVSPALKALVGDTFEITAGCDKSEVHCSEKFSNLANFRGFPHMPGDDWAAGYPNEGGAHDGGSLFRG